MDYELAKKLKDAGFPKYFLVHAESKTVDNPPTLSELIEACGEGYFQLKNHTLTEAWNATITYVDGTRRIHAGNGPTPEEAVANLYLALHSTST